MAVQKSYKERMADIAKHRAEMKVKRAAAKKAKAERKVAKQASKAKRKAAKKPVSVEKTKGGDYPVYKKESKKAESFRSKFGKASKAGKKTFKWKGRSYTTEKAAPKKTAKPDVRKIVKRLKPGIDEKSRTSIDKFGTKTSAENGFSEEREKKQMGGMVDPAISPSLPQQPVVPGATAYDEGGKVESNPYGWPTRDARSGLSEKK